MKRNQTRHTARKSVVNTKQIHVYTYSEHGKSHICSSGVPNVAFAMFARGENLDLHDICHTIKHEQIQFFVQCNALIHNFLSPLVDAGFDTNILKSITEVKRVTC